MKAARLAPRKAAAGVGAGEPRSLVERLVVEETDQQVGAEAHAFPADEEHQQVVPENERGDARQGTAGLVADLFQRS